MLRKYFKYFNNFDYVHNVQNSGFPYGLYVEIFTKSALIKVNATKDLLDREHVTRYFKSNTKDFKIGLVKTKKKYKYLHLTVDTYSEFIAAESLIRKLSINNKKFSYRDL